MDLWQPDPDVSRAEMALLWLDYRADLDGKQRPRRLPPRPDSSLMRSYGLARCCDQWCRRDVSPRYFPAETIPAALEYSWLTGPLNLVACTSSSVASCSSSPVFSSGC